MEAGQRFLLEQRDWKNAAISTGNLSQLTLLLGKVGPSLDYARQSVELAYQSGDAGQCLINCTTLGDALHAAGRLDEAEVAFREAEALQTKFQSPDAKLISLWGFRYCDLLLSRAAPLDGSGLVRATMVAVHEPARCLCEEIIERAQVSIEVPTQRQWLLDDAHSCLTLGRASLGLALATAQALHEAMVELERAVRKLRAAAVEEFIPLGLLARATLHRFNEDVSAAESDLKEALEIAERGSMRLHECDAHLEWGRLRYSVGDREGAREHLEVARKIVEETGYGRREREVRELSEALGVVGE